MQMSVSLQTKFNFDEKVIRSPSTETKLFLCVYQAVIKNHPGN